VSLLDRPLPRRSRALVARADAFWDAFENRLSRFLPLLNGVRLAKAARSAFIPFLLDEVPAALWDEDFPRGKAYTRSILLQGCAANAEAFLMLQRYAGYVILDAGT
jgi:hypothetical protein